MLSASETLDLARVEIDMIHGRATAAGMICTPLLSGYCQNNAEGECAEECECPNRCFRCRAVLAAGSPVWRWGCDFRTPRPQTVLVEFCPTCADAIGPVVRGGAR